MWEDADTETRKIYEKKEAEDKERYEKEMREYNAANAGQSSSAAPSVKKVKATA